MIIYRKRTLIRADALFKELCEEYDKQKDVFKRHLATFFKNEVNEIFCECESESLRFTRSISGADSSCSQLDYSGDVVVEKNLEQKNAEFDLDIDEEISKLQHSCSGLAALFNPPPQGMKEKKILLISMKKYFWGWYIYSQGHKSDGCQLIADALVLLFLDDADDEIRRDTYSKEINKARRGERSSIRKIENYERVMSPVKNALINLLVRDRPENGWSSFDAAKTAVTPELEKIIGDLIEYAKKHGNDKDAHLLYKEFKWRGPWFGPWDGASDTLDNWRKSDLRIDAAYKRTRAKKGIVKSRVKKNDSY